MRFTFPECFHSHLLGKVSAFGGLATALRASYCRFHAPVTHPDVLTLKSLVDFSTQLLLLFLGRLRTCGGVGEPLFCTSYGYSLLQGIKKGLRNVEHQGFWFTCRKRKDVIKGNLVVFLLCNEREKERNEWGSNQNYLLWAGETGQCVRVFAAESNNLSSIHEIHMVERENQLLQAVF